MALYINGKRMPDWYKPELYTDEEIEEYVRKIYFDSLSFCDDDCPCRCELDDNVCCTDIVMELWRKWHNAEAELNEKENNSKKENSQGVLES